MEDSNSIASNVARAIVAALDWSSSPDSRKAASAYLDSFKAGDIHVFVSTSFLLVKKDWSLEIRIWCGYGGEELSSTERQNFANVAVDLMSEIASPCEEWALKSQAAALVAEAELVSMMLRWLPEDITVHNEDLEGDRRRFLLRGLTQSLPEILPLLYTILERHFGAALSEAGRQQLDLAKQHVATVTAALNAANAYAEWAPIPDLAKYGIIHGCGFLLSSPDFRLHACEFFKLVSPRKRPTDASSSEFDSAMGIVFQILMKVSGEFLHRSMTYNGAIEESEFEFAEYICESMVSLGSTNLQCIMGDSSALSLYIQQMLGYFQHFKFGLHFQSLPFWLALVRDSTPKPKSIIHATGENSAVSSSSSGSGQAEHEKRKILNVVNDDIFAVILDTSFIRLLKREKVLAETALSLGALELWSDDFEGRENLVNILELIRLVASEKPLIAAAKVSERNVAIIKDRLLAPMPLSMQLALENVIIAVFDDSNEFGSNSEMQLMLGRIFEGLLQQLLLLKWTDPLLVELLGRYLDALGPFLKFFPDAVGSVITTSSARHARLQICTSIIRIAKLLTKAFLPHMKGIAETMARLQREERLLFRA
ncbi:Exportin-5, C-terminal domain [Dillenia turbinata]|uniref:Exportin-5, C-terminal domain n=1 Tax=Dillenia turbinata TaxID=194707 RepID=A0AAN8UHZ7_9MAGN